jgi:hypothetical protein
MEDIRDTWQKETETAADIFQVIEKSASYSEATSNLRSFEAYCSI